VKEIPTSGMPDHRIEQPNLRDSRDLSRFYFAT
jgi:hypothetical protein